MDPEVSKTLAQYGLSGILLGVVGWIVWKVGLRMIAAIDRLGVKIEDHTTKDLEHHAEVREEIAGLRNRFDAVLDITPVEGIRRPKTNPHGLPTGYYSPRRPPRDDEK